MIEIVITPITPKGIEKIKEHVKCTRWRDIFIMKRLGVTQELKGDLLVLKYNLMPSWDSYYEQPNYKNFFQQKKPGLINSMAKMGIEENIDYTIEVVGE